MNRRSFFGTLLGASVAAADPDFLKWKPGERLISIPKRFGMSYLPPIYNPLTLQEFSRYLDSEEGKRAMLDHMRRTSPLWRLMDAEDRSGRLYRSDPLFTVLPIDKPGIHLYRSTVACDPNMRVRVVS